MGWRLFSWNPQQRGDVLTIHDAQAWVGIARVFEQGAKEAVDGLGGLFACVLLRSSVRQHRGHLAFGSYQQSTGGVWILTNAGLSEGDVDRVIDADAEECRKGTRAAFSGLVKGTLDSLASWPKTTVSQELKGSVGGVRESSPTS